MPALRSLGVAATLLLGGGLLTAGSQSAPAAPVQASCQLNSAGNQIKRVIYLNFDNVHFRRDNPNVPSDLEQMPNLLNFIVQNGVLDANHWTPLISHTAVDLLTAMTGVYGDRMGMAVANSYGYFKPDGSVGFASSFLYWTALSPDGKPNMINELGKMHPAPWVPYTRAGCDVGAFSVANIVFERLPDDVRTFFGVGSPQDIYVTNAFSLPDTPPNQPARNAPNTDFLGIGVHCAQGSPLCNNPNAVTDPLPDEPGGYVGFKGLFGNIGVAPAVCAAAPTACNGGNVTDLDGNVITDAYGRPGFPNVFSPTATQSLGYASAMLEAGVPIIYVYVADAHDRNPLPLDPNTNKPTPNHAFGPGEAEYVSQLKKYDTAFGKFFARLTADGIDKTNTLFVIVPDENDHFVGSAPSPANCDGVNVPCTYTAVSEINAHINRLLLTQRGNTTPFAVHSDDAPTVYITGNPSPTAAVTRTFEKDLNALFAVNPITNNTEKLSQLLADQAEMKLLHMVTPSPARTPSLTMFGNPNYFFFTQFPDTNCSQSPPCISLSQPPGATFAWNHGDVQREITNTWMAMVGPGVKNLGVDNSVFSDHTDVRPTILSLLGLKDDYVHDGRLLAEKLSAVPLAVQSSASFANLANTYKQLNATLGALGTASLTYANRSIISDDTTYAGYLSTIGSIASNRDALASEIKTLLDAATFYDLPINDNTAAILINAAQALIAQVQGLATASPTATHDFNGDGRSDIAFQQWFNPGSVGLWLMNGSQILQTGSLGMVATNWLMVGQRDFNGDGFYDLLWFDDFSGTVAIWLLNGLQVVQTGTLGAPGGTWHVVGTGDFNGDGKGDILFRDSQGNVAIWLMNGLQVGQAGMLGQVPSSWSVMGTADFNGDGKTDILWQDSNGNVAIWLMNGLQIIGAGMVAQVSGWSIKGTGDFNGDGKGDIVWQDANGNVAVWLMNAFTVVQAGSPGGLPANWMIAETGDFNGDGKSDLLWRDTSGGTVLIWFMNGVQVSSSAPVAVLDQSWVIQGLNAD